MLEAASLEKPQPVTARIERVIQTVPGWTPADQLLSLHVLAASTAYLGGDVMEIGSWCGRSSAVLGHAVAMSGVGHVWAIDLFPRKDDWSTNADGSHSFAVEVSGASVGGYQDQTVWDEPFQRDIATVYARQDDVLEIFKGTIEAEKLGGTVTPFRGTGTMFAAQAPKDLRVRMAFLDGDHSYDAVCTDIDAVEKFLVPGGWITFDDAFSVYDGVDAAIRDRILNSGRYEYAHQVCRKFFVARLK
ncbi:class I SAM-dependent methyltransferase [Tardiphaga sp. 11_C7_N12_6]|uniref:class I SAM-dependent methyltransferase n=1 Tax=Tardiphaga sp. 11_C7_N12_6 TaxID=3240789 RepID=UPI003F259568